MQNDWSQFTNNGSNGLLADRYRLRQSLGKGSFGEVFYAEDVKFEPPKPVAVKLLHAQFVNDPQVREDIKREAGTLGRFNHPNILNVIDYDISQERAYIVTSLAEGGSLGSKIRPDPTQQPTRLPLTEVAGYLDQIADALDEAHSRGLIHRDIKPLNILLDRRGRPLLADFGLAAALSGSQSSVMVTTNASGTPLYMAPEQWNGQAGKASDIYALGVVVYQLITGQPPFQGNQAALAYQHMAAPVPTLRERAPDLVYPPALDGILARVMAKSPAERPRSASEFARQFRAALQADQNPLSPPWAATRPAFDPTQLPTLPLTTKPAPDPVEPTIFAIEPAPNRHNAQPPTLMHGSNAVPPTRYQPLINEAGSFGPAPVPSVAPPSYQPPTAYEPEPYPRPTQKRRSLAGLLIGLSLFIIAAVVALVVLIVAIKPGQQAVNPPAITTQAVITTSATATTPSVVVVTTQAVLTSAPPLTTLVPALTTVPPLTTLAPATTPPPALTTAVVTTAPRP